jgi:hypothetical protein
MDTEPSVGLHRTDIDMSRVEQAVIAYGHVEWHCGHRHGIADHPHGRCEECAAAREVLLAFIEKPFNVASRDTAARASQETEEG